MILGKRLNLNTKFGGKMKNLMMTLSLALLTTGAFAAEEMVMRTVELKTNKQIVPKPGSATPTPAGIAGGVGPGGIGPGGIIPPLGGDISGTGPGGIIPPPLPGTIGGFPTGGFPTGGFNGGGFGLPVFDRIGQVISIAQNVVALGESVYTLVQKGKPSVTTDYAPISIVPRDPLTKEIVNPFDMEDCGFPQQKKYRTTMTTAGMEVVSFEYMVIYSAGCSYEGAGKYIQTLNIVPTRVKVGYGWDFNASMKLTGLMNHGKKLDPNVGALLTIKYSMKSWRTALERNDTVHVTGAGALKTYSN